MKHAYLNKKHSWRDIYFRQRLRSFVLKHIHFSFKAVSEHIGGKMGGFPRPEAHVIRIKIAKHDISVFIVLTFLSYSNYNMRSLDERARSRLYV